MSEEEYVPIVLVEDDELEGEEDDELDEEDDDFEVDPVRQG